MAATMACRMPALRGMQRPASRPWSSSMQICSSSIRPCVLTGWVQRPCHLSRPGHSGSQLSFYRPAASAADAPAMESSSTGSDDGSSSTSSAPKVLLTGHAADPGALPDVLAATFPERFPTLSAARKVIRRQEVLVDGVTGGCATQVSQGQLLQLVQLDESRRKGRGPRVVELKVVYEDEDLAVVLKPWGVKVYGGDKRRTITGALEAGVLRPSSRPDALDRPQPVHRLDAAVGGLLVVGKTRSAVVSLSEAFNKRQVSKTYLALLCGQLQPRNLSSVEDSAAAQDGLELALSTSERSEEEDHDDEGAVSDEGTDSEEGADGEEAKAYRVTVPLDSKKCITKYICVGYSRSPRYGGWLTTVALSPVTGRKHQLRRHVALLGTPIVGDGRYSLHPGEHISNQGLYLEAVALALPHPATGEVLEVSVPEPERFQRLRVQQESGWLKQQRAAAWAAGEQQQQLQEV